MTISVVLATYNEEQNLATCLDAVKDWADEIVVVDGESTDKTKEVALRYTKKVITTNNKPMFHINKQMAITAATSDWILQLDADEIVSEELKKEITTIINNQTDTGLKINGYWMPRKNFFLGRFLTKGGQYPDYTLRLYRKNKGKLPCKSVHEQAMVEGETGYLKKDLLHYADKTFAHYLKRWSQTYTEREADDIEKNNPGFSIFQIVNYCFIKPKVTFFMLFFRHRGYVDGFSGFVFALFSGLRFMVAYVKYWERKQK